MGTALKISHFKQKPNQRKILIMGFIIKKNMVFISAFLLVCFGVTFTLGQEEQGRMCYFCVHDTVFYNNTDCRDGVLENANMDEGCSPFNNLCMRECYADQICLKQVQDYGDTGRATYTRTCVSRGVITNDPAILDECQSSSMWSRSRTQCVCNEDGCNSTNKMETSILTVSALILIPFYFSKLF